VKNRGVTRVNNGVGNKQNTRVGKVEKTNGKKDCWAGLEVDHRKHGGKGKGF